MKERLLITTAIGLMKRWLWFLPFAGTTRVH
jgi:hypothetical protein